jgi:hypothetical protein
MQKVVWLASRFTDSGLRYYIHLLWDKCTNARQKIWQSNLDWQKWTVFFKQAYKANIIGVRSKTAEVLHLIGLKVIERTTFIYGNLKWIEAIKFFYALSISMYGMISTMFFFVFCFHCTLGSLLIQMTHICFCYREKNEFLNVKSYIFCISKFNKRVYRCVICKLVH